MSTSPYQKLFHNFWIPKSQNRRFWIGICQKTQFWLVWPTANLEGNFGFFGRNRRFREEKIEISKIQNFSTGGENFWKFSKKSKIFWKNSEKFENEKPSKFTKSSILFNFGAEKPQIRLDFRPEPPAEAKKISDFGEAKKRQKTPKFLALAKKTTINLWNPKFWLRQKTTKNFQWPVPTKSENLRFWVFCRKFFSRNLALAKIGEFFGEFPKFCRNFGNPKKMFLPWIFGCFVRISKKFSLSPMNLWILTKDHTNFRINSQIRI